MGEQERKVWKDLLKEIQGAIKEAVSLKITTIIGDVKTDDSAAAPTVANSKTMYTKIDLVQGDIVTMIDQAFLAEDYASIREYHNQREEQAQEIIKKNIDALKELASYARELLESSEA